MKDKTFADYCMRHGVVFPADTVVIKMCEDDVDRLIQYNDNNASPLGSETYLTDVNTRPIFKNMIVEYDIVVRDEKFSSLFFYHTIDYEHSGKSDTFFIGIELQPWSNLIRVTRAEGRLRWDYDYNNCRVWPWDMIGYPYVDFDEYPSGKIISSIVKFNPTSSEFLEYHSDNIREGACLLLESMAKMHQRAECELITHNRGTRRTTKRKTGKEPSPYFLLKVDPTKPQKRYVVASKKTQQKNKQHIVRGHFRHTTNHPIASFNGTFWIPSHMRGNEQLGKVQKGYRIVLPDNEEQLS